MTGYKLISLILKLMFTKVLPEHPDAQHADFL